MKIPVRFNQKSYSIKSPCSIRDLCSSNNYNTDFSNNTFRSKSISLINKNADKFFPNKTTSSNNLSQIIKFLNTGKMNQISNNCNYNSNNSNDNIIYAKNDLFYTRKKITQKPNSPSSYFSFDSSQFNKPVISRKNRYVFSNYNRVFADNTKENKSNFKKKYNNKKDEIINNIHKLKKNVLNNKNKSFIANSDNKYKSLFNSSKNNEYDDLIFNTKKKKKCLLNEINMLKNEFQKDIIKQNSKYELTSGGAKNNKIINKMHNLFKTTRNYGEELRDDEFFNKLDTKKNNDDYCNTQKAGNLLFNNFKY